MVETGQMAEADVAQQRQVDREGEGAEAGGGADVAGRLLPPDVLFAGGKREDEWISGGAGWSTF